MSNTADSLTALSRRTWIGLVIADVVLFVRPRQPHRQEQQPPRHRKQRVLHSLRDRRRAAHHAGDRQRDRGTPRSITMNPVRRAVAILGAVASILTVGVTSATSAASSGPPTLKLALNGRSVLVSGALQSGAKTSSPA